ncbi:Serine/threonine-protein kinase sck2 [Trichophyton interdigitale]|uniref:Serine/threonine-protein kinase sck2 n=1 Tax=Trichophyton interdigitale TaxID=101480 RepID=A0A9P4YLI6_9EURO|nr:Serine/threonine-protein kinase sck2 [Trichophyton interdigitale]KAF3901292.1 Serine/threonine-protein kinase sck2 [Trichophyton interdigitale]KAG8212392.1 Serine/threonine-protein kinase sck2 [Trichophyton interdigitale]
MDEETQPSTQPYADPRRKGVNNSGLSQQDVADIICILHPNSPAAHKSASLTADRNPQHILQRDEFDSDLDACESTYDIALRFSSLVKDQSMGFCFGRSASRSDIIFYPDHRVSNTHFRIYLKTDGILMLQDTSTNGTIVDGKSIRRDGGDSSPTTQMLMSGSVIHVTGNDLASAIKFVVRIPARDELQAQYTRNLTWYLNRIRQLSAKVGEVGRGEMPAPGIVVAHTNHSHGMHWNGGAKYNVTGQIGKGAFATVYKLATKNDGAVFACKELDKRRLTKNNVLDHKVDSEMRIMKDLDHPNIVRFHDYFDFNNRWIYIIMEYIGCGELSSYLQSAGLLPEDQVQKISRQLLHALQYLHARKITHRDIKPDNILISSYDPFIIKLSDFGLSKVSQEETLMKTFCGTLLYCAPEVYPEYDTYKHHLPRKRRRPGDPLPRTSPYDQSVDMWSFGAVAFHILSGHPPFMGRGDDRGAQMLRNIMTTEADYSLLENVGASEEAIDFISRLLNRDPKARPKEPECFQHPWIAEVPDEFEYEEVGEPIQTGPLTELIAVPELSEEEEQDEKDAWARRAWSLERELEDKREAYCKQPDGEAEQRLSSSDQNANAKKPRVTLEQDIEEKHVQHQDDVRYPSLPQLSSYQYEAKAEVKFSPNGPRLFGEITPSFIKSSGVLGEDYSEEMDIAEFDEDGADDSSDQYVISNEGSSLSKDIFAEVGQPHPPLTMRPPPPPKASDPSLMGAESLVGHLHMRSAGQNGMASGDRSDGDGDIGKPLDGDSQNSKKYASSNGTAKGNWAELKPGPFSSRNRHSPSGDNLTSYRSVPRDMSSSVETNKPHSAAPSERMGNQDEIPNELACTIDERTGLEVPSQSQPNRDINVHNEETKEKGNGFVKPATILGKLTPLPGSILDQPIRLESRMTSWGRGTQATIRHPDSMDFRIPSYALELTFWAPSIEARIAAGEDWLQMTDVVTLISTKTSQCIWVNDVELRKESRSKDAFLFGRIYTGDIITVYRSKDQFLRFRCEFYHGKSRLERPADEKRFLIEESPKSYCNARTDGNPAAKSERPPVEASA